ncbi:MAG TPA: ubiquinol-cytochrome C chaperone family protein [Sphingomicrobium sp.]|nr:ubiquinol-cytochrome C chaperone family protein [Sphingomicrobium sp.]
MINALFARLTGGPRRGHALFDLAVAEARRTHWFLEGEVPDTVNGRFAVLATIVALITLRLEQGGEEGAQATVALTERMVETLDAELREMGLGDPTLGKQVRGLVGAVAGRVERWRALASSDSDWAVEVRRSLYLDEEPSPNGARHGESALRSLWQRLAETGLDDLSEGRMS